MELRPITEKPKKHRGIGWFLIWLIILGFIAGVALVALGVIRPDQIPHP